MPKNFYGNESEAYGKLVGTEAAVFDIDDSIIKGLAAEHIGARFLQREIGRIFYDPKNAFKHLGNAIDFTLEYGNIKRKKREEGPCEAMRYFFGVMGKRGIADKKSAYDFAKEGIAKSQLPGAHDFIQYLRSGGRKTFLVTIGCDIASDAAREYFECDDSVGNPVFYNGKPDQLITGCGIIISDNKKRGRKTKLEATLEMLEKHNISIMDCAVFGDSSLDHGIFEECRVPFATPLANPETIELAESLDGAWISDYEDSLHQLKKYRI